MVFLQFLVRIFDIKNRFFDINSQQIYAAFFVSISFF